MFACWNTSRATFQLLSLPLVVPMVPVPPEYFLPPCVSEHVQSHASHLHTCFSLVWNALWGCIPEFCSNKIVYQRCFDCLTPFGK